MPPSIALSSPLPAADLLFESMYRESDFDFVTRLREHEGICWYFEHTAGHHKLILVDSASAHDSAPSCDSLPYIEHGAEAVPDTEFISDWHFSRGINTVLPRIPLEYLTRLACGQALTKAQLGVAASDFTYAFD